MFFSQNGMAMGDPAFTAADYINLSMIVNEAAIQGKMALVVAELLMKLDYWREAASQPPSPNGKPTLDEAADADLTAVDGHLEN